MQDLQRKSLVRSISTAGQVLRTQLWIWPIIAALILAGVGWWLRGSIERAMKHKMAEELQTLLDADVAALLIWFDAQQQNAEAVAQDDEIARHIAELAQLAEGQPADLGTQLIQSPQLKELRQEIEPWIASSDGDDEKAKGYAGFLVIDTNRRIVAADRDDLVLMANQPQLGESYFDKEAIKLIDRVLAGHATVSKPFASVIVLKTESGQTQVGVPTMFAMAPIRDDAGQVIAALGLRIEPHENFTRILSVAQAGETGETYAFDHTGLLISQSRFDDNLKKIGLLPGRGDVRSILNLEIRDPGVDLTRGKQPDLARDKQPLTLMAATAIPLPSGEELRDMDPAELTAIAQQHRLEIDADESQSALLSALVTARENHSDSGLNVEGYRDYRGVRVVGAWRWLPGYDIGVASELDAAEAYEELYILRWTFWGLFGLLATASVAIFGVMLVASRYQRDARRAALEARQLGQYALDEKIGEGGMGVVYKAHHAMLRRPTAVKLLDADKTNPSSMARFEREVQLTSKLNHPNTIQIYDYGRTPEGVFYYAMEYLEGLDLEQLIVAAGPQPEGRVIFILRQLCGSLAEAHEIGAIHRDIKPGNIILSERGGMSDVVKLLDFGLVKAVDAKKQATFTAAGSLLGTPSYMSPEAVQEPDTVDARSDLYAVGAVGYFLLTGQQVFDGKSIVEICTHHVKTEPTKPSERLGSTISDDLEQVILSCLAKDAADRPQTARELNEALTVCSAVGSWSEKDARQWWQQRQRTTVKAKGAVTNAHDETIIVD